MNRSPAPLDSDQQPPLDRYCDLVLTGGVTDGVVYPWAVVELARQYRFKNIGGTSVGAMAAALTAAAEYGRRHGSLVGFNEVLLKLPSKLAEDIDKNKSNNPRTRIFSLFQPAAATRKLFDLFVRLFASGGISLEAAASHAYAMGYTGHGARRATGFGIVRKGAWILCTISRVYWRDGVIGALIGAIAFAAFLAVLILILPIGVGGLVLGVLLLCVVMLIAGAGAISYRVYRDVVEGLVPNDFGLCTGGHADGVPAEEKSLVEWLHEGIQAASGKALDQPLTFDDLWRAPGGPVASPAPPIWQKKPRSIDLRMITTNLTHGRPYEFPQEAHATRLFFRRQELEQFFPAPVLDLLERYGTPYSRKHHSDPDPNPAFAGLLELPRERLPVLVAARLSLSFPILFSAVPLWAIDYEPADRNERKLRRCRFSDGGICSNFPIHMFDSAVPEWPTFGILLGPQDLFHKNPVKATRRHYQGGEDRWYRFDDEYSLLTGEQVSPVERLLGFLGSLLYSAKDWNDKTAARMPGVRDRIANVALESQGGLDLMISGKKIMDLARNYGQPAGQALVEKFIDRASGNPSSKWDEHRWVRFNSFLVGLRERVENLSEAMCQTSYGTPVPDAIVAASGKRPLEGHDPAGAMLTAPQQRDLQALLAALQALEAQFAQAVQPQPYKPVPPPSLHLRAPL